MANKTKDTSAPAPKVDPAELAKDIEAMAAISAGVELGTQKGRVELSNGTVVETF